MAATLRTIAEEIGVSTATVSLAIRNRKAGKKSLSQATIKAVHEAAKRLGYRPNMLAKNLASSTSKTIGVLLSSLAFGSESLLDGVSKGMGTGFTSLLSTYNRDETIECAELDVLVGQRVGGIIAACSGTPANLHTYKEISESYRIPMVLIDRPMPGLNVPVVRVDHFACTYQATKSLLDMGHKKIICSAMSFSNWIETPKLHTLGYQHAMREAGLAENVRVKERTGIKDWVVAANLRKEVCGLLDLWAAEENRATAILVDSDWVAYEILNECSARGIRVPEDVSLMGIGDFHFSSLSYVGLSTVKARGEYSTQAAVGINAAMLLTDIMSGKQWEGKDVLLPVDVILRRTTARV